MIDTSVDILSITLQSYMQFLYRQTLNWFQWIRYKLMLEREIIVKYCIVSNHSIANFFLHINFDKEEHEIWVTHYYSNKMTCLWLSSISFLFGEIIMCICHSTENQKLIKIKQLNLQAENWSKNDINLVDTERFCAFILISNVY